MADLQQSLKKLQELRDALNANFKERDQLIEGMLCALIAKRVLFILGPPGTGKSAICEAVCNAIQGEYFAALISKFTVPEELFGPPSFANLQKDIFQRVTKGRLPEATIAFLDEIFKGSSAIQNTLLPIVNERIFDNNGRHKIPLETLYCASNEIPADATQSPLYDRMILRYQVDRIQDVSNFMDLLQGSTTAIPTISEAELACIRQACLDIKFTDEAAHTLLEIRMATEQELGLYVSDRRWKESVNLIKAQALLSGNTEVAKENLMILENIIWAKPEDIKTVRRAVRKLCNPLADEIQKIVDAAEEVYQEWKGRENKQKEFVEVYQKIKASGNAIQKLSNDNPNNQQLKTLVAKLSAREHEVRETGLNTPTPKLLK